MVTPKPWAVGDKCPACSVASSSPFPQPSDAQRAAAANHDNPTPLPPTVDHASPEQVAELGDLHRCTTCGYSSRAVKTEAKAKKTGKGAGAGDTGE
jgi:Zn ribbon nucleic-acid-binding protein